MPGPRNIAYSGRAASESYYLGGQNQGTLRDNGARRLAGADLAALTTQVMTDVGLYLEKGDVVKFLTFLSGGTAAGTPTNWWFALYSPDGQTLLGQTADQTNTAWAANTPMKVALASPYTVPATGVYRAAVMVKATTVPTLAGDSVRAAASAAIVTGQTVLAQTSGTGLTATAPATIATPTAVGTVPYVAATSA
jgi:hypothetical protein